MHPTIKIICALISGLIVWVFLTVVVSIFLIRSDFIGMCIAILPAYIAYRSTLNSMTGNQVSALGYSIAGGLIIGGISFAVGFFGPMLLFPEANQGPLLGLLITGPGGLVVGTFIGFFYAQKKKKQGGSLGSE